MLTNVWMYLEVSHNVNECLDYFEVSHNANECLDVL
jgi:hypothetical protein